MSTALRRLLIGSLAVLASLALLLLAALAYLRSDAGRARLVEVLNRELGAGPGIRVQVGHLGGDLWRHLEIRDLTLLDEEGVWLRVPALSGRWSPAALLAGRLHLASLDADGPVVLRAPASGEEPEAPGWPELPLAVSVDRFALREVRLEPALLGEAVTLEAAGEIGLRRRRVRARLDVDRTDGVAGALRLELALRPGSGRSRLELTLEEPAGGLLARALDLEGLPPVSLQASAEGPRRDVRGTAQLGLGDLARIEGRFALDLRGEPAVTLDGRGEIAGLLEPPLRQLLAGEIGFAARVATTEEGFALREGRLDRGPARLELSGELRGFAVEADAVLALPDVAPLADLAGVPLRGGAELSLRLRSADHRRGATAVARATLTDPLAPESPARALVGSRVTLEGRVEHRAPRRWTLRDLTVAGAGASLTANGSLDDDGRLAADYQLGVPDLAVLSELAGVPLAGALTAGGELAGEPADPALSARLASGDLSVNGIALGPAEARIDLRQVVSGATGELALSVSHASLGPVSLASGVAPGAGHALRLAPLRLDARDATARGALDVDRVRGTATGRLAAREVGLAAWSEPAGRALSGVADVSLELRGADQQELRLDADLEGLSVAREGRDALTLAGARVTARVTDAWGVPRGELRLEARDGGGAGLELEEAAITLATTDAGGVRGELRARGAAGVPVSLELAADYRAGEGGFAVRLDRLVGSIDERPVRLTRPVEIRREDAAMSLSSARLAVADGWLTAEGRVDEERIAARVEVDRLPLSSLDPVIPVVRAKGSVSGRLTLGGTRREPVGELDLRAAGATLADASAAARTSVPTRLRGEWRSGRCRLEASLGEATGTALEARGSLPLRLDAETLALSVPPEERVEGELAWSGELGPLWDLLTPNEDRFTGSGALSVQLSGRVAAPELRGRLEIGEGRYENVLTGSALADLSLRVVGDGERIRLEQLGASDGAKGRLSGRGVVELLPARGYPVELELELADMLLVARDELILTGGGRLGLGGTLRAPALRGEIEIGRSELTLAGSLPPEVVELEVEEVRSGVPIESAQQRPDGAASALALDVRVVAPGRVFARGLGLDSEWSGDLAIGGTAAAPRISGVLSPVRGHLSLMGKRFALKKGAIRFTGGEEVDPLLDLSAERREGSVTAVVQISGTASDPRVKLTSRPPLPEAEIASQVLFGTGSSNLTPAQSLQLASALATYSGIGGPVGILDRTRRAFGVDVIGFAESEQDPDATRVSVGKYISDGVYLEVESGGAESSHTATTVEVEVLPDIRVEGGTTERGSGKVGVKWTWDY